MQKRQAVRAARRELEDEALQDLWLGLLRKQPPNDIVGDNERLLAWLIVVYRARLVDLLRKERVRSHLPLEEVFTVAAAGRDKQTQERNALVHDVLNHLGKSGAAAAAHLLLLRYIEGISVAEIAGKLRISPRAVSSRLQRARKKFKAAWLTAGGEV